MPEWSHDLHCAGMRRIVREVLPGARFRRHLYWRWSAVWTAPAATGFPS